MNHIAASKHGDYLTTRFRFLCDEGAPFNSMKHAFTDERLVPEIPTPTTSRTEKFSAALGKKVRTHLCHHPIPEVAILL
jgi:hypothetical protein